MTSESDGPLCVEPKTLSNLTLFCRTKLKLPYRIDSDADLLPYLIHQLGSAYEWSGV